VSQNWELKTKQWWFIFNKEFKMKRKLDSFRMVWAHFSNRSKGIIQLAPSFSQLAAGMIVPNIKTLFFKIKIFPDFV